MINIKLILAISFASICSSVYAGDGKSSIDLNFIGTVIMPSCVITFDGSSVHFDETYAADIHYYNSLQIYNSTPMVKTKKSGPYFISISGCQSNQIATDASGKQFTFTIAPTSGTWVNLSNKGNGFTYQMNGAIQPTSGATDYAVRVLVPATFPTTIAPTSWKTFTGAGITSTADTVNGVTGTTSSVAVALSDLVASGTAPNQTWKMPVLFDLGLAEQGDGGTSYGHLDVSGVITASYF